MMKLYLFTLLLFCASISLACNPITDLCNLSSLECPSGTGVNKITINDTDIDLDNFDVICYQDFNLPDGDIQGRAATRDNWSASTSSGVSIGDQLSSANGDVTLPYSVVVGRDATWSNGEVYPLDSGLFVGRTATLPGNLANRVFGSCSSTGCLDDDFDNSKDYYEDLQDYFNGLEDTTTTSTAFGTLTINCTSSQPHYVVSVNLRDIIAYSLSSTCNPNAIYLINVRGTTDVLFDGTPLEAFGTIYNIIPRVSGGRVVNVRTAVYGTIINPRGTLNQTSGTIYGWTISNNCLHILQVNRPRCRASGTSTSTSSSGPVTSTSTSPSATTSNSPITSSPSPLTTRSAPITSSAAPLTTRAAPITSGPFTSRASPITSSASPITSGVAPITSSDAPLTTNAAPITSSATPLTSGRVTSNADPITSGRATSGSILPVTSRAITSNGLPITSGRVTTGSQATTGSSLATTGECICPSTSSTGSVTTGSVIPPPVDPECPFINFEDQCPGYSFLLGGFNLSFVDYDVISFGNFVASTGDTEGRLAVRRNLTLGNGFSIADKITTNTSHYSLIANYVTWGSGRLYVDGEGAFVGSGNFTAPEDLRARLNGSCDNGTDCLGDPFSAAQECYQTLQDSLASNSPNVNCTNLFSQLRCICNSSTDTRYYASISGDQLTNASWYGLENCNDNAQWILNVDGSENVTLSGGEFPHTSSGNVLYNILGENRTIFAHAAVNGGILSPFNILDQRSGVIRGKVVVGDVAFSLQINLPVCPLAPSNTTTSPSLRFRFIAESSAFTLAPLLLITLIVLFF